MDGRARVLVGNQALHSRGIDAERGDVLGDLLGRRGAEQRGGDSGVGERERDRQRARADADLLRERVQGEPFLACIREPRAEEIRRGAAGLAGVVLAGQHAAGQHERGDHAGA